MPPGRSVAIFKDSAGVYAVSTTCTHLGCVVSWSERKTIIHCPCHDGFFNAVTGAVVSGPPPLPLPRLRIWIEGS